MSTGLLLEVTKMFWNQIVVMVAYLVSILKTDDLYINFKTMNFTICKLYFNNKKETTDQHK